MEAVKSPKIEAIYPLNYMQQGLLFHHLSAAEDEGFIHVQCTLLGIADKDILESAWNESIKRHAVLRSTLHWENLEKPVRLVHPDKSVNIHHVDWTALPGKLIDRRLADLKTSLRESGPAFQAGPLLQVYLISTSDERYELLWPTHHLLLDGWSSQIILKEVLERYNALVAGSPREFPVLPTYDDYLAAVRKTTEPDARRFWSQYLDGIRTSSLVDPYFRGKGTSVIRKVRLSEPQTCELKKLAADRRITPNTLIQGAWAIVLSKLFTSADVVFGITVSGRSTDLDNLHLMSGMFMNVHPFRTRFDAQLTIAEWLTGIQKKQAQAMSFEHLSAGELMSYSGWPAGQTLFDTLLVYENYPSLRLENGSLQAIDFRSGLTSAYPLTLTVIPGNEMEFSISVKPGILTDKQSSELLDSLVNILMLLSGRQLKSMRDVIELKTGPKPLLVDKSKSTRKGQKYSPVPPRNNIELRLLMIWESLFGRTGISIHDNYFDLGGKSLLAVQLFSRINKEFQVRLLPTTILQNPTIASLADLLEFDAGQDRRIFKNLVPIRSTGTKAPLFCIHAGGGHVFFYKPLADLVDRNRPVYAIQPSGIYNGEPMHPNIETMAGEYVNQIIALNPEGPYNLLAYCFSTAVGLEMVRLFSLKGMKANFLVMDSFVNQESLKKTKLAMRITAFVKRLLKNPLNSIQIMLADRFNSYLKPHLIMAFGNRAKKDTARVGLHLVNLYNSYNWDEYSGDITLILTHKIDDSFNRETIGSWRKIIRGEIRIVYTQGNHRTIFEHPDIVRAAETIEKCCL